MTRFVVATLVAGLMVAATLWFFRDDISDDPEMVAKRQAMAQFQAQLVLAEKDDAEAQYAVARYYQDGRGVKKDRRAAFRWHSKAAKKGLVAAHYALGAMYDHGEAVKQDYYKAAEWYSPAAHQGRHPPAQFALGQLYFHGRGVVHDYAEAVKWYRRAAERGHPPAQFLMGAVYQQGWAVPVDLVEAYMWYTLAIPKAEQAMAVNQSYNPVVTRDEIAEKLNQFQISRALQKADLWRQKNDTVKFLRQRGGGLQSRRKRPPPPKPAPENPAYVKLLSFEAPVKSAEPRSHPLAVILQLPDMRSIGFVCQLSPRIRDTVVQVLTSNPLTPREGKIDFTALADLLLAPINRTLDRQAVSAVTVVAGSKNREGKVVFKMPMADVRGCRGKKAENRD